MNIKIEKYGFLINYEVNKSYSGFNWKASNGEETVIGQVNFSFYEKKTSLFIETPFTPVKVETYPIFAMSKSNNLETSLIYPGNWILKFVNLKQSSSHLTILATNENSYDGKTLIENAALNEQKTYIYNIKINDIYNKLFFKKSNYSQQSVELNDIMLINKSKSIILSSDESLIKVESENVYRENNKIIFSSEANIWSFFSIQFYAI